MCRIDRLAMDIPPFQKVASSFAGGHSLAAIADYALLGDNRFMADLAISTDVGGCRGRCEKERPGRRFRWPLFQGNEVG